MRHDVPVVALAAGAVPDTMGTAGVLLEDASPQLVAASVHEMLEDEAFRSGLVSAGRDLLAEHSLSTSSAAFVGAIRTHLASADG
jgi:glycosyltransferase involved in cell wall biosynthesis